MYRNLISAAVCGVALVALPACTSQDEPRPSKSSDKPFSAKSAEPTKDMQEVLDALGAMGGKPIETLSPAEARKQPGPPDAVKAVLVKEGKPVQIPVGKVEDRKITGPAGQIPVRIYTPDGNGPFPVLVYYHGGGWVLGTLDTYDSSCRALASTGKHVVVSVDYRLAPEHKFPAASDDSFAAYQWVVKNAASINGDPKRVAVGGESAGGNLATVTALQARDKKVQMPTYQLIVYPVANHAFDTESYRQNATAKPLNADMMKWFSGHYLASPSDAANPYASPLRADLTGLPPATVITATIDPLMSEGKAYSDKLEAAGVKVRYKNYDGVTHEFFGMGAAVPASLEAIDFAVDGLNSVK